MECELLKAARRKQAKDELVKMRDSIRDSIAFAQAGTASVCVMLLPARTDTKWFHRYVYNKAEIRFVKGRLKFGNSKNSAPFPSMVVVFKQNKED